MNPLKVSSAIDFLFHIDIRSSSSFPFSTLSSSFFRRNVGAEGYIIIPTKENYIILSDTKCDIFHSEEEKEAVWIGQAESERKGSNCGK